MIKKLLMILVMLFWCSTGFAEEFYIECIETNYKTNPMKFIFKINTLKRKMTLVDGFKGKQVTEEFTAEKINLIIKDVETYEFDDENKDLILSYVADYQFHLNRVSGKMTYIHLDPRKEDFQKYDSAKCERTKPKI